MHSKAIFTFAASVTGVSVAVYLVYRYIKINGFSSSKSTEVKTSRPARIEVKVPKEYGGYVVGRGGHRIKEIEKETSTRIVIKPGVTTEDSMIFEIRGAPENAQLAETRLYCIISAASKIENEEILIPQNVIGKLIGRAGQNIKAITKSSKTIIKLDEINEGRERNVKIRGTREQIEMAKSMIYETVSRGTNFTDTSSELPSSKHKHVSAMLGFNGQVVEVLVSAVENPSRFWIQVYGQRSLELDDLEQQMTSYYAEPSIQHSLKNVSVGQLVASAHGKNGKWNRARVMEVTENELTLFYVDYGDTAKVASTDALALDLEFAKLQFQAVECELASVIPESGEWTDEANKFFKKLCRVAEWKSLNANLIDFHDESRGVIAVVELYNKENGKNITISEEMVKGGFAKFERTDH